MANKKQSLKKTGYAGCDLKSKTPFHGRLPSLYKVLYLSLSCTLSFKANTASLPKRKIKSCYNPLRPGTVIILVSSGIDFVNTPRLYSDRATR